MRIMRNSGLGLSKAIVTKTADKDKDGYNRISVKTCGSDLTLENVPVLVDMAGKEYGRVVNLKEGDFVLIGYVGADPEQPIVLGSFYDPSKKPPLKIDGKCKNTLRYFKTATGLNIKVDDSKDKGGVYVVTKDEHKIEIQDISQPFVQVASKDGKTSLKIDLKNSKIEIKCQTMSVTAEKSITMKAGDNQLVLDGNGQGKINVKSGKGNILLDANKIDEKAKMDVNLTGTNIKLNAKAQLDAKANGTANFKASGPATIGGAVVKIG